MGADRFDVPADWYDGYFEGAWLDHVALRAPAERTQQHVEFVLDKLELEPGSRVLDLACGHGRISLELARRGYRVTGLDLSLRSLELASAAAETDGLAVEWVRADMREIPEGPPFDAVLNVFTSFGYFADDAANQRVLDGVAQALAPGGGFLIDVVNLLGLAARYRASFWDELDDGVLFLQAHSFDLLAGRNRSVWTFIDPDGRRSELAHSVRAYAPHELAAMIRRAGMEVVGAWGGFDGSELSLDSRRRILVARVRS